MDVAVRQLAGVTLVCIDTTDRWPWSLKAVRHSMAAARFGRVLFLTDRCEVLAAENLPQGMEVVQMAPLTSVEAYSRFVIESLPDFVTSRHVLIVQWDGFITHPQAWNDEFLSYDYVGAPWTNAPKGQDVGNGGFCLRSTRLMKRVREASLKVATSDLHPEDVFVAVTCRPWLEAEGMRFPTADVARRFSVELGDRPEGEPSFGFHGPYHFPEVFDPRSGELSAFIQSLDWRALNAWWMGEFLRRVRLHRYQVRDGEADWANWTSWLSAALTEADVHWCAGESARSLIKSLIRYGYNGHAVHLLNRRSSEGMPPAGDRKLRVRAWVTARRDHWWPRSH